MRNCQKIWPRLASSLLVALTAIGLYKTLTGTNEGILIAYGAENLKYFTVDSNLLLGLVYLLELILSAACIPEKNERVRLLTEQLLYIATVAVALTFTVVAVFFGPSVGYAPLYQDANLYFHLIIPVLAIASYCLFHRGRFIPLWETSAALIPSMLYGAYYTVVLLLYGAHFPETDWYGFASGGIVGSVISASGVFLVTWAMALLLRLAAGGTKRQAAPAEPS